ncbi:DUF6600 domain-containing protein [uncultured Paludibaculum sp.]|uniref:DUF6600 domain-containing protein n=1 Tax=uncultured Paludibaculum sp. TaxID=1765020 RepID=UPI002AAAD3D6|nr:DUF6600 domain-containing protein [uncultured Paludibaculum sp.]
MKRWLLALIIPGMLLSGTALAQQEGQPDDETSDGPGRGVARVSLLNGDVSVRRGDSGDWVAAAINAPLLAEDRVMTGPGARAEVQLDFYNRIRLAADTEIRLSQLDQGQYQVQVARGLVTFSALKGSDAQVEISTPGAALRPLAQGDYRISVSDDGMAEFTVRSGEADIASPNGTQRLRPGRTMQVRLEGSDSQFQIVGAIPRDAWDQFNEQRNQELSKARESTYQYVSRDVYGAEDLNGYGEWVDVPPYGWSWRPYVADGWAPYRYGRWGWMDYYGWSWISYDPWGWAPYHYGRWYNAGGRWCWYPGARVGARHYWSPALVGWVGWDSWGGFNAGVGVGWGAVGWIPLAPFEPVHRWWGRGYYGGYRNPGNFYNRTTYVTNINVTNVYRNARINNGVTVVNGSDFSRGYAGRPMRVGSSELGRATMAHGAVPVAPTRESLRWSDRAVNNSYVQSRTATTSQERFYSRRAAPRVDRVPFETQRQTLEHVASRGSEASTGSARSAEAVRGGAAEGRGWRQATDPNGAGQRSQGAANEWQRFGDPSMSSRSAAESGAANRARENSNARQAESSGQATSRGTSGWQRFGDPGSRTSSSQATPATDRTSDSGNGFRGSDSTHQSTSTPRWSTGGGGATRNDASARSESSSQRNSDSGRSSSHASPSPRMESARPSSGGGSQNASPRSEPTRSASPSSGGGAREASPSRGRSKGNDAESEPMAQGNRSSGGSSTGSSFAEPASSGLRSGSAIAGGGSFSGNSGTFGTGASRPSTSESRGALSDNSGNFGMGANRPSVSEPRSGFSGNSGSFGSGSSSPSSSASPRSGGSFGGSGMRSSGGGFSGNSGGGMRSGGGGGGAARSSGGGGGGSHGGRGR